MSFDPKNLKDLSKEDLNLYFTDTYLNILLPDADEFQYCFVRHFDGNGKNGTVSLALPSEKGGQVTHLLSSLKFDFIFPDVGYYSVDGNVHFYYQVSERQNKKGMNAASHRTVPLLSTDLLVVPTKQQYHFPRNYIFSLTKNTNDFFKFKIPHPCSKTISKVLKGELLTGVLSRDFAISLGIKTTRPSIWYRNYLLGELIGPNKIEIHEEIFYQECLDFFNDIGINVILNEK